MTREAMILLVLSAGGNPQEARVLDAFAMQESSRAARGIHVPGDDGKAWGVWQFHRARWQECGGALSSWGKAGAKTQARVMLAAYRKYTRASRWGSLSVEQRVIVAGRYHNRGHCKKSERDKHYRYTRSVWKHYRQAKETTHAKVYGNSSRKFPLSGTGRRWGYCGLGTELLRPM